MMPEEKENGKNGRIEVFPFIEGKTIDLVAFNSKWVQLFCKWNNDPKVRRYARNMWPHTIEEVKKWFEPSPDRHTRKYIFLLASFTTLYQLISFDVINILHFENLNLQKKSLMIRFDLI